MQQKEKTIKQEIISNNHAIGIGDYLQRLQRRATNFTNICSISLPVLREQQIKDLLKTKKLPCIGLEVMRLGVVCVVGPFASSIILLD